MVNVSRNKSLEISRDIYTHLWVPFDQKGDSLKLWKEYSEKVYPYDHLELGIRTKYFMRKLENSLSLFPNLALINIGSGFTSHQYLVDNCTLTIEVDYPHIIQEKKRRAELLQKDNVLPERNTVYVSCDLFNEKMRITAFQKIQDLLQGKKTIVLCEGLIYYLDRVTCQALFHNIANIQHAK